MLYYNCQQTLRSNTSDGQWCSLAQQTQRSAWALGFTTTPFTVSKLI